MLLIFFKAPFCFVLSNRSINTVPVKLEGYGKLIVFINLILGTFLSKNILFSAENYRGLKKLIPHLHCDFLVLAIIICLHHLIIVFLHPNFGCLFSFVENNTLRGN